MLDAAAPWLDELFHSAGAVPGREDEGPGADPVGAGLRSGMGPRRSMEERMVGGSFGPPARQEGGTLGWPGLWPLLEAISKVVLRFHSVFGAFRDLGRNGLLLNSLQVHPQPNPTLVSLTISLSFSLSFPLRCSPISSPFRRLRSRAKSSPTSLDH